MVGRTTFTAYGTTRFLSAATARNGQQAALALDAVELLDALGIGKAIVAGFDWGARTADIVAALWPERVRGLVAVSGYVIGNQEAGKLPLPPQGELQWWYDALESRLVEAPVITVPTITLEGDANGAPHPEPSAYANKFSGGHSHRTIEGGIGHNPPQEAPEMFAQAVIDVTVTKQEALSCQ